MKTSSMLTLSLAAVLLIAGFNTVFAQTNDSFSDAEIASIAVTANEIDVETAQLARDKSNSEAVRNYANTMINDHTMVINQAQNLVSQLGVTPQENSLTNQLRADAQQSQRMLQNKEGAEFDKAYIDHEIRYHQRVIETVQDVLIPNAENEQLRNLLEGIMPTLETHLRHAEDIQSELEG